MFSHRIPINQEILLSRRRSCLIRFLSRTTCSMRLSLTCGRSSDMHLAIFRGDLHGGQVAAGHIVGRPAAGHTGTLYTYNTYGITSGDTLRFPLPANTAALATGHYDWSMDVTTVYGSSPVHTFTGSQDMVNRNSSSAPFGRGWQLSGLDALAVQGNGVLLVRSDGTTLWFASNGAGGFLHAEGDGTYSTLLQNANQTYTLSDTHGNQTNFSSGGLLTSRVDANGNTTSYSYTSGLLTQITDPYGRSTTLSYTSGRLSSVSDFAGRSGTLAYDASGRLTSITQPDPDGGGSLSAPVTSFTYDATTHCLTRVTNALSQNTNFAYGTHGRLTSITHPDNSVWNWTGLETVGLPTGTTGNTISRANPTGTGRDAQGIAGTFRTDRFGNVTQWIDPLSHSTLTERNADGLSVRITQADPDGTGGPLTSPVTVLGYNAVGDLVYQRNPDGYSATWTYTTSLHRVSTATDVLSHTTSFSYDTAGNLTSATDAAGKTTSYTYNSHGLPTSVTLPDPDGTGPLSAAVTSLAYDSYARLTTLTNPDSSTRTLGYNAADNITSDTDELAHAASFTYDALGRLTSETDRAGAETSYAYNAVNIVPNAFWCAGARRNRHRSWKA